MDWHDTLERAIPHPPPGSTDPAALVAEGKKAVRRRQALAAGGAALIVAAVIGLGSAYAPWRDRAAPTPPIATQSEGGEAPDVYPTQPPLSDASPLRYDFDTNEVTLQDGWEETGRIERKEIRRLLGHDYSQLFLAATNGEKTIYANFMNPTEIAYADAAQTNGKNLSEWAEDVAAHHVEPRWSVGGSIKVGDGWTVTREIDNPLDYDLPWDSDAAVAEREGMEVWILFNGDRPKSGGGGEGYGVAYAAPGQTIDGYLAHEKERYDREMAASTGGYSASMSEAVEFGDGSELVPAEDGVEILEQVADPDLGERFAEGATRSAAARITVKGKEQVAIAREKDGLTLVYTIEVADEPRSEDRGARSLEEVVAIVRATETDESGGGRSLFP
ncbi:hypothetical protein SAMN05428985_103567 [Nocardioides sp. YR527]|uniref:hypothetical protein n=1 Tax=Nocardioides sp. YR527 TaxID=1881028 RepID=UPI000885459A|nr:hypothetical protein [Nocardioides sp. YR527]SDK32060.1 hypothetical protein SAMN05428985_103567 [Nocardioides sp. YR527]